MIFHAICYLFFAQMRYLVHSGLPTPIQPWSNPATLSTGVPLVAFESCLHIAQRRCWTCGAVDLWLSKIWHLSSLAFGKSSLSFLSGRANKCDTTSCNPSQVFCSCCGRANGNGHDSMYCSSPHPTAMAFTPPHPAPWSIPKMPDNYAKHKTQTSGNKADTCS